MSGLPSNIIVVDGQAPKGEPDKVKYTMADLYRGAYGMLLPAEPDFLRKIIVKDTTSAAASRFARNVAGFAEDEDNRKAIEKFLTANPSKGRIVA